MQDQLKTYPTTETTEKEDALVPYNRHVCWFQELRHIQMTQIFLTTLLLHASRACVESACITNLKLAIDCIGHQSSDRSAFNRSQVAECIEEQFDYDGQPYWCSAIHRDFPIL